MFDCKQDIGLLHGSLSSAAYRNSNNLFGCANVKKAVHIVYESIKMIIHHSLKGAKNETEKLKIQLCSNQKLHAALFFTTLRSHGIKSKTADEFYESILCNWPSIDFQFYVELIFKCDWSEYFVMCALQLPSEILFNILKMIFEIPFGNDVENYSWHLILQTLIFKLLEVSHDKEVHYPFDFDFVVESAVSIKEKSLAELPEKNCETIKACGVSNEENYKTIENSDTNICKCDSAMDKSNSVSDNGNEISEEENANSAPISQVVTEFHDEDSEEESDYLVPFSYEISDNDDEANKTENEDLTLFKEMCCNIYENIALKLEKSNEVDVLKILLHAVKTISKHLITMLKRDGTTSLFESYIRILKDYISADANQEKLKIESMKSSVPFARHAYATVSWNVCQSYVILLLRHYTEKDGLNSNSLELIDESKLFYENIIYVVESLYSLNYPFLKSDDHVTLLCKIIQLDLEGSSYVTKVLFNDSSLLKGKNVLAVLEENCHVINLSQSYSLIVDHIMSADCPEMKQSLLKILFKCLQMNKLDMHNKVIGYILDNYGFTKEFQLPDCKDQLSDFTFQTPSQEEIEKKIPALLVQNPESTLKYLLDQALLQGPEGKIFVQILKHFQNVCFYTERPGSVCILHEILSGYLSVPKLKSYEEKNMITLYSFLVNVHSEMPILFPCNFFSECLIPKLHPECDKIQLILECTEVLLPALLSDIAFLEDSTVFCNLISKFGILANHFIENGNGLMKSLVISILKNLEDHQQKNKQINEKEKVILWSTFKDFNEMTCVYFETFLPEDIDISSRAAVWIRCCKNGELSNFEENFSVENLTYISLLNTLVEVLPHLTSKEWSYCFSLVKLCCKNYKLRDEIISSKNHFQLCENELDIYAIVSTVITSLHFVLNDNADRYVSSCFSNFLKDVVFKEKTASQAHLLLSIALEFGHLISSISPDIIHMYKAVLLEMQKEMSSQTSDPDQSDCSELLNHVVTFLSNLCQDENTEQK